MQHTIKLLQQEDHVEQEIVSNRSIRANKNKIKHSGSFVDSLLDVTEISASRC